MVADILSTIRDW